MCWCERCHVSPTLKLIIFMSKSFEWLNVFLLWDKALDPLSHRLFFSFLNSFSFIQPPLLMSVKKTHQLVFSPPHRQHFVVCTEIQPLLQRKSFAVCHTFLLTLIHMKMRILSIDFSPYTNAELCSLHHMSTHAPSWGVLAAQSADADAPSSSKRWLETWILAAFEALWVHFLPHPFVSVKKKLIKKLQGRDFTQCEPIRSTTLVKERKGQRQAANTLYTVAPDEMKYNPLMLLFLKTSSCDSYISQTILVWILMPHESLSNDLSLELTMADPFWWVVGLVDWLVGQAGIYGRNMLLSDHIPINWQLMVLLS